MWTAIIGLFERGFCAMPNVAQRAINNVR